MAYVTIHTLSGSVEELHARKQAHFDPVVRRVAPAFGAIFSITATTNDNLLIINVWEDAERVSAFTAAARVACCPSSAPIAT